MASPFRFGSDPPSDGCSPDPGGKAAGNGRGAWVSDPLGMKRDLKNKKMIKTKTGKKIAAMYQNRAGCDLIGFKTRKMCLRNLVSI